MSQPQPIDSGTASMSIQARGIVVLAGLFMSAIALGLAPMLMPASYSWVANTTSESAAQGIEGAWLARLGFLMFGLSVLIMTRLMAQAWGMWATALHTAFGVFMVATATFSHRPWDPLAPFDRTEDLLHSITATGVGFAFAFGVVAVMFTRKGGARRLWPLDVVAVAAAVLIPLSMTLWGDYAGLLQRLMFLVAYAWYAAEIVRYVRGDALPLVDVSRTG
jgi:hypothetical protein